MTSAASALDLSASCDAGLAALGSSTHLGDGGEDFRRAELNGFHRDFEGVGYRSRLRFVRVVVGGLQLSYLPHFSGESWQAIASGLTSSSARERGHKAGQGLQQAHPRNLRGGTCRRYGSGLERPPASGGRQGKRRRYDPLNRSTARCRARKATGESPISPSVTRATAQAVSR